MAAPGPGAGAASGGAGCSGGGGAGAGSGSGAPGAGGRLPSRVLELVFSYLELSELRSCALVCKHWYRCLHGDENSEVWRSLCARSLAEEALRTDILCNLPSYKAKIRAFQHAFSTNDCSRNVYIKKNGFTLHRNPIAQSTDGARTKIGFSEGRHAWEVWWEGPLGTVAVIGIATKRAPMQCQGYVALLGSDDQSWGWNLVDNNLLHNGEVNGSFPQCNNAPKYQIGERIRVILDMEDKTLAFERGYEFLGVAFRGLPKGVFGHRHAQRRIPHEDKGRDWVIQQKPRNVKDCQQNYQMLGKRRHGTDSSLTALRRNQLCPHFDLGLLASRTVRR